jgi:hypothetical protein
MKLNYGFRPHLANGILSKKCTATYIKEVSGLQANNYFSGGRKTPAKVWKTGMRRKNPVFWKQKKIGPKESGSPQSRKQRWHEFPLPRPLAKTEFLPRGPPRSFPPSETHLLDIEKETLKKKRAGQEGKPRAQNNSFWELLSTMFRWRLPSSRPFARPTS